MSTISKLAAEIKAEFLDQNRDLLACLSNSTEDVFTRMSAALTLDRELNEEFGFYGEGVDQPGYAGKEAKEDVRKLLRRSLAVAFNRGMANGVIRQKIKLTDIADSQLIELKIQAGLMEAPAQEPVVPIKSAQEQLEDEVAADFNGAISTDKMKAKMNNNIAYRNTYKRLAETNRLESRVTTLHDAGKVGG
jgi:hypothetical protein